MVLFDKTKWNPMVGGSRSMHKFIHWLCCKQDETLQFSVRLELTGARNMHTVEVQKLTKLATCSSQKNTCGRTHKAVPPWPQPAVLLVPTTRGGFPQWRRSIIMLNIPNHKILNTNNQNWPKSFHFRRLIQSYRNFHKMTGLHCCNSQKCSYWKRTNKAHLANKVGIGKQKRICWPFRWP